MKTQNSEFIDHNSNKYSQSSIDMDPIPCFSNGKNTMPFLLTVANILTVAKNFNSKFFTILLTTLLTVVKSIDHGYPTWRKHGSQIH